MDFDERVQQNNYDQALLWFARFGEVRDSELAKWVSTYRNDQSCVIVIDNLCGSFNWSVVVKFEDGLRWLVRFAVAGKSMSRDEKVRNEVGTMRFVKTKTKIPVPEIIAWGLSDDNPLNLGPFIIMEFVEGKPLNSFLEEYPRLNKSRPVLRPDVNMRDLETIYRQVAGILLELSKHDFPKIGSLAPMGDENLPRSRPLTLRMNEIEAHGGVKVACDVSKTFPSATEYFHHVADQEMQHLQEQPNSIDDENDARGKYRCKQAFRALIPRFVSAQHDHGPFKLRCDDFRFGNMLVNNYEDLKIVAVVDWEWTWAAPHQLVYSPPRWLAFKHPVEWESEPESKYDEKYTACFKIFLRILQEEEEKSAEFVPSSERMSTLMQLAMNDGKFWFHELVFSCFEGPKNAAWTALRSKFHDIDELLVVEPKELDDFVSKKMDQLAVYSKEWDTMRQERETLLREIEEKKSQCSE